MKLPVHVTVSPTFTDILSGAFTNDVALVAVPEPGAILPLLGGTAMLLGLRRRRA